MKVISSQSILKLAKLATAEGYSCIDELLANDGDVTFERDTSGICMNEGCDFVAQVYYNTTDALCHDCNTKTVASSLIIAGVINE